MAWLAWPVPMALLWWNILENIVLIRLPTLPVWSFKLTHLTTKLFQWGFFYNSFSLHTLAWACMLHLTLQLLLVSFISQPLLNRFQTNLYYCLPYVCSTSTAIFRLILSLKVILECTLHSRVKHSITHISIINFSSNFMENCCSDVSYDSTILCRTTILVMSYFEFFAVGL